MRPKIVVEAGDTVVRYRLIGPAIQPAAIIGLVLAFWIWRGDPPPGPWSLLLFGSLALVVLVAFGTWVVTLSADGVCVDRLVRSRSVAWGDIDRLWASSYRGSAKLHLRTVHGQQVAVATFCDQVRILELLRLAAEQGLVPPWVSARITGHEAPVRARDWPRLNGSFWSPLGPPKRARDRADGRRR